MTVAVRELQFKLEDYEPEHDLWMVAAYFKGERYPIAVMEWDGGQWIFVPRTYDGDDERNHARAVDVDPRRRLHLDAVAKENLVGRLERNEAINEALDAALVTRRREFRDETLEDAELAAKLHARWWWRVYRVWIAGCTGAWEGSERGWKHDAETCPIHEA